MVKLLSVPLNTNCPSRVRLYWVMTPFGRPGSVQCTTSSLGRRTAVGPGTFSGTRRNRQFLKFWLSERKCSPKTANKNFSRFTGHGLTQNRKTKNT